jgi:hypothetical protein
MLQKTGRVIAGIQTEQEFALWLEVTESAEAIRSGYATLSVLSQIHMASGRDTGLSPPPIKYSACLEVRESALHGMGVCANSQIPAGVIVTRYPADCRIVGKVVIVSTTMTQAIDQKTVDDYKISLDLVAENGSKVSISSDRNDTSDRTLLGHMVNDACDSAIIAEIATIPVSALWAVDTMESLILRYVESSLLRSNCAYVKQGPVLLVKTLRQIAPDEELTISYTLPYWLSHFNDEASWHKNPLLAQHFNACRRKVCERLAQKIGTRRL